MPAPTFDHDPDRYHDLDVLRRFPPLRYVEDDDLAYETSRLISEQTPAYFYTAPATSHADFHNDFCTGERGLWIHTLMVAETFNDLVWTDLNDSTEFDQHDADCGLIACLLHDMKKHGDRWHEGKPADEHHALIAAQWIRQEADLPEQVANAVASHMGPTENYGGPEPKTRLRRLVHRADMSASRKAQTVAVSYPPTEVTTAVPNLPVRSLDGVNGGHSPGQVEAAATTNPDVTNIHTRH